MSNPKISIIIPVYNVEAYLEQCLNSVIQQTLPEIEIICVNDGSTDRSPQILEEFAKKDARIKIINKKNGGIGSARNKGLEHIIGEYVGFVDSDDWVEAHMYEKLYENATANNCDMVMCSTHLFDEMTQKLSYDEPYFTLESFDESFDGVIFDHNKTASFLFGINVTAWNKLYKASFLKENNILFPTEVEFEDNPFFYEAYLKAKRVSLVRDPLYFYRVNRNGSFINLGNRRFFDIIPIHKMNEKIIKRTNKDYLESFFNFKVSTTISRYNQVDNIYKGEFLEIIKEDFAKMNSEYVDMLNELNQTKYNNLMKSYTYQEYELYEKISQLNQSWKEKLTQQSQEYQKKLDNQIKNSSEQIKQKNEIIRKMKSSKSWKITKPLRKLGSSLKKIKK
jgi:glycosyltransferase involved in cell wall biosynthesis